MPSVDITPQLNPLFEAIQSLSRRMDSFENTPQMSHNSTAISSGQPHVAPPSFGNDDFVALPPTGLRLPIGPPGPPPDDGGWPGDGGDNDEEEELVAEPVLDLCPTMRPTIVSGRTHSFFCLDALTLLVIRLWLSGLHLRFMWML
jgi:hypothetical protein